MNAVATRKPEDQVRCPRCGYDARGEFATWTDACPMSSRCAECGLEIEWAEVLSPTRRKPRWCVEYAPRWWNVPGRSVRTLLMLIRPWRFWSELKMSHEPRWGRVAGFFIVLGAIGYTMLAGMTGARVAWDVSEVGRAGVGVVTTAVEVAFCGVYATLMPFSDDPPASFTVVSAAGGGPYPPTPLQYLEIYRFGGGPYYRVNSNSLRYGLLTGRFDSSMGRAPEEILLLLLFALLPILTTPIGFLALPVSRRRAKVQWRHVARISCYALPVAFAAFGYVTVRFTLLVDGPWYARPHPLMIELWHLTLWGVPLLLLVWWTFAIARYLRMPHALGVGVAIVFLGMLLGPAMALAIWSIAI